MENLSKVTGLQKLLVATAILVFLVLAIGSVLTHRPQIDEGMFADPARNLAEHGTFGTTSLETDGSPLLRIANRTYWVMPVFLLNVAASFEVFGFGLTQLRMVSVLWGLVLLTAIFMIAVRVSRERWVGVVALVVAAGDYMVLETASSGRMDMMSSSLGFLAVALYLVLRERSLLAAVLVSHTVMTIDGLTHPNAIMAWLGLVFLTIYFDRSRIRLSHVLTAAIPYLVGGTVFGYWVMLDAEAFRSQFIDNATMGGRMQGFSSPLANVIREFTERYPHAYGLRAASSGHSGPIYLKSLILVGYVAGLAGVVSIRELRNKYAPLIVLAVIYSVVLAILDGQKQTTYLIHVVPLYAIFAAAVANWCWVNKPVLKVPVTAIFGIVLFVSAAGMAYRISQNTIGTYYRPMTAFLNESARNGELVMGGSELIFGLDPHVNHIADGRFGFYSKKRPEFIVTDSAVEDSLEQSEQLFPAFFEYFPKLLREEYSIAYENAAFKVYRRKH
ncbi:MAG: hypothetical protein K1X36_09715 [Pyrinomonadaceae bacterium]|nr:hypothetical protein [Pyrinomonadaceae bacterium]